MRPDRDVEGQSLFDVIVVVEDALHAVRQVFAFGLGEKADVTEVDAEQRHLCGSRQLGCAQQRAVAAEDEHHFGTFRGSGVVGDDVRGDVQAGEVEVRCFGLECAYADAGLRELDRDLAGAPDRVLAPGVRHDQDAPRIPAHCGPASTARRTSACSTGGAPWRNHRKYSTLPAGPGSELATT